MNNMKRGFTMIELIFVIVIIGILAAVAIPRLAATRDDAKIAAEVQSAKQALNNLGAEYTAQGAFTNYNGADADAAVKCFTFSTTDDGNVTISFLGTANDDCPTVVLEGVKTLAAESAIIPDKNTSKVYQFGGISVKR